MVDKHALKMFISPKMGETQEDFIQRIASSLLMGLYSETSHASIEIKQVKSRGPSPDGFLIADQFKFSDPEGQLMSNDIEKHVFVTDDGVEYEFDNAEAKDNFAIKWTMGNLAARGLGELITVDGEEAFRINDKGRAWLAEQEKLETQSSTK